MASRLLFIVARDKATLFEYLTQEVSSQERAEIILDRRRGERREGVRTHEPERRRAERRCQPGVDGALRSHGFVVIRTQEVGPL